MLRRSRNTPIFDTRFVNYGYNKMQLIQHLRYKGYTFYVLVNSFAMDMPHRNSNFRKQFLYKKENTDAMGQLYSSFLEELTNQYSSRGMIPICKSNKTKNFYKSISL